MSKMAGTESDRECQHGRLVEVHGLSKSTGRLYHGLFCRAGRCRPRWLAVDEAEVYVNLSPDSATGARAAAAAVLAVHDADWPRYEQIMSPLRKSELAEAVRWLCRWQAGAVDRSEAEARALEFAGARHARA